MLPPEVEKSSGTGPARYFQAARSAWCQPMQKPCPPAPPARFRQDSRREAEMLEQHVAGRRLAVAVDAHHGSAAVLPPEVGDAHLHGNARNAGGQHFALVDRALPVERGGTGHGHHPHRDLLCREQLLRLERQLHFRAGGDDHGLRPSLQPTSAGSART